MTRTLSLVVRNVVFTLVVPGLGGVWLPWRLLTRNGGTPAPAAWAAVAVIAAGAALYFWGEAWLFASPRLLAYAAAMAFCFHLFVTGYEERTLARRFGPAYLEYRRAVPRWIPRKP
jgi:protein-S-isoprenylcysteine O-methyltransferase Ste14